MSLAKKRYLFQLNKLSNSINEAVKLYYQNPEKSIAQLVYENDGRTPCFQLEGLARIDSKISRHERLGEKWLERYKKLEDALGMFDYWFVLAKKSKIWNFPVEFEKYFQLKINLSINLIHKELVEQGWLGINKFNRYDFTSYPIQVFEKEAERADWFEPVKEKKKLLKFFKKEALEIHDDIKNNKINLELIEDGIHEFRRNLRWLGIYSSSLNGKVVISEQDPTEPLYHYITKENRAVTYNNLPVNPEETDVINFLQGGFYSMTNLIAEIGELKDAGLWTNELLIAANAIGMQPSQVKELMGNNFIEHSDLVQKAKDIITYHLFDEELLVHISNFFDMQLEIMKSDKDED